MRSLCLGLIALVVLFDVGCNPPPNPMDQAAAEIKKLGGQVKIEDGRTTVDMRYNSRFTDEELSLLDKFPKLVDLTLESLPITDEGMNKLEPLKYVSRFILNESGITGKGLKTLTQFPLRRTISDAGLRGLPLTDEDAQTLTEFPRLGRLDISGTKITDRGLETLSALPLTMINVKGTKITEAGIAALKAAKPNVEVKR